MESAIHAGRTVDRFADAAVRSEGMIIRDLLADDAVDYQLLLGEVYSESGAFFTNRTPTVQDVAARLRGAMLRREAHLVAEHQGRLLGWVDVVPYSFDSLNHAGNLSIGVRAAARGRGVGSALLRQAMLRCRASKLEVIHLETFASNKSALALYKNFGFKIDGIRKKAKRCPITGVYDDIVLMSRWVN